MKIIFATNNLNKLLEIKALMPKEIEVISLQEIGCSEDIPETGTTLEANAFQKAHYIKEHYGFDCFADDTGLEIEALKGAPGIYSARYAGPKRSAEANIKKVLYSVMCNFLKEFFICITDSVVIIVFNLFWRYMSYARKDH